MKNSKPPKTREPVRLARDRIVNIIFFIDSSKTRTFKMKWRTFLSVVVGAILIVVGAFVAAISLYRIENSRQIALSELRRSQSAIFDYQTRFDGIYEVAYPQAGHGLQLAAAPKPSASTLPQASASPSPSPVVVATASLPTPTPLPVNTPAPVEGGGLKFVQLEAAESVTLMAENPQIVFEKRNLQFSFDLRNTAPDAADKSEGRLYAIAAFEDGSGRRTYLAEPRSLRIGADGKAQNPERGIRYNVARFHRRDLKLGYPAWSSKLKLVELTLVLRDKAGTGSRTFRVDVNRLVTPQSDDSNSNGK